MEVFDMKREINVNVDDINMKNMYFSDDTAELVGLWVAEGDDRSKNEITITNNSFELIEFSYNILYKLFKAENYRLYVYLPDKNQKVNINLPIRNIRYYLDIRANKPYFILRIANVKFMKEWRKLVGEICIGKGFYAAILRGFFAGEGNIKTGSHSDRTLRIAQKEPIELINQILKYFNIEFRFSKRGRSYEIFGRKNWEKLADINIADLHPIKKKKFWEVYSSYKQWHYEKHHIRNTILNYLNKPRTSSEIAKKFNRSQSRIQSILTKLKREGGIKNFRVRSRDYWLSVNSRIIPISGTKMKIMNLLDKPKKIYEIANNLQIDEKSVSRRLNELKELGLVDREGYGWNKNTNNMEVLVCD